MWHLSTQNSDNNLLVNQPRLFNCLQVSLISKQLPLPVLYFVWCPLFFLRLNSTCTSRVHLWCWVILFWCTCIALVLSQFVWLYSTCTSLVLSQFGGSIHVYISGVKCIVYFFTRVHPWCSVFTVVLGQKKVIFAPKSLIFELDFNKKGCNE